MEKSYDPELKERIDNLVNQNKIVFMKGTKLMPQCGFSNNVVQILNNVGSTLKQLIFWKTTKSAKELKYSNWPTIPQVYIDGNLLAAQTF